MSARPDRGPAVVLLTMLVALGPISTDLYLPSLPAIRAAFAVSAGTAQLTLSVFMAGFAVSQLVYGPVSDRFGRRPALLGGLALYLGATLACALAGSIGQLIAARFVQALGACAGPVLARATVRDVFDRQRGAEVLAYMTMAMALAPALGPMAGGYLQVAFGWRAAFAALLAFAVLLTAGVLWILPETNAHRDASATDPVRILANYRRLVRDSVYRGYVVTLTCTFAGLFAFVSGASFTLIEGYGLSPDQFALSFAVVVVGYMIGTFLTGRLTRRLGTDRLIALGVGANVLGGAGMVGLVAAGVGGAPAIVACQAVYMLGAGLVLPNSMAGAVGPYPRMAGSASALLGFVQMGFAGIVGVGVGQLADGSGLAMASAVALAGVAAAVTFRRHVRRGRASAAA
ncbi:MFS transporter, DHA1 family, bicyclomycin/chloramphenicol resistance protein [Limimonas halophila]|uniref:Bcr/CflA family efflux transporter n=1 Tax=Limimonas halophila TaxID=1082479 RepID=A0A1G7UCM2_9PROT|nr:multidrug effflux MFS transporter [Limimonas halophila]SDG44500.1 MFS transporter, DHA1 family, bicyclomycin/chloramphenicol resistance protein [Limimonas halophila]